MTLDKKLNALSQKVKNIKGHSKAFAKGAAATIGVSVCGALAIASLGIPLYGSMASIESLQTTKRTRTTAELISKDYQTMPNTHNTYVQGTFVTANGDTVSACDCPRITEGKPFPNQAGIAHQDTGKTYDVEILETQIAGHNTGHYLITSKPSSP